MRKKILLCMISALLGLAYWSLASGGMAEAKWPEPSPGKEKSSGKLVLDISHTDEGYFMARVSSKNKHKLKLRVTFNGETLTYDLNGDGDMEVFPFQMGSGYYEISLWENVSGKKYSSAGKFSLTVKLKREDGAFLYPSQYVNYTRLSAAVAKADELCAGKTNEKEIYSIIRKYMSEELKYDFVKAATVKAGQLPDIDGCFDKKMGVCQDLSAIMVCMLRTQGVPARLIIGYADRNYHAWTMTVIDGKEVFFDPTAAVNGISKPAAYSIERYY